MSNDNTSDTALRDELLEALERMDALMDMLWKAVPWGQTFNLDVALLNTAPMRAKAVIMKAKELKRVQEGAG